jgi:alpha-glucosidase
MRPLVLEFPDDAATWGLDDQFMFGGDLLIAPVLQEAQRVRDVYLPKGEWFDFWSGRRYEGPTRARVTVALDTLPVFVRAGAFVFRQPVVQHTGQMRGQPLEVQVFPAAASEATLYEDDGETLAHVKGESMRRRFTQQRTANETTIGVAAAEGTYRPAARDLVFMVQWSGQPGRVVGGSTELVRYAPNELAGQPSGWSIDDNGFILIKQRDSFGAMRVTIAAAR